MIADRHDDRIRSIPAGWISDAQAYFVDVGEKSRLKVTGFMHDSCLTAFCASGIGTQTETGDPVFTESPATFSESGATRQS